MITPPDADPFPTDPAPERSTTAFDAYRRALDTVRDTTKWVIAIVPGVALAVTALSVLPQLAALEGGEVVAPAIWLAGGVAATATAVAAAGWVLAARPAEWSTIVATYAADGDQPPARSLRSELDRAGVLPLYGYDAGQDFFDEVGTNDPAHIKTAPTVAGVVVDFATWREVRRRFVVFLAVGVIAALVAVVSVASAQSLITRRLDTPLTTAVRVRVIPAPDNVNLADAGCHRHDPFDGWLVSGSLVRGGTVVVAVDDSVCPGLRVRWSPATDGPLVPNPAR